MPSRHKPLLERFAEKINKAANGCWLWKGMIDHGGYGRVRDSQGRGGESLYAHRFSYEIFRTPIPKGLVLDHLCRNRACVNPDHLKAIQRSTKISTEESRMGRLSIADHADAKSVVLLEISEKEFRQQVLDLARILKWHCYFTWNSIHSPAGFPDLIMLRQGRMIVAELKKEGERPTDTQRGWLNEFRLVSDRLGGPLAVAVCIWHPSDWETIQEVLR